MFKGIMGFVLFVIDNVRREPLRNAEAEHRRTDNHYGGHCHSHKSEAPFSDVSLCALGLGLNDLGG